MCGSGSVVEHLLAKEKVAGSNPVFRSGTTGQCPSFLRPAGRVSGSPGLPASQNRRMAISSERRRRKPARRTRAWRNGRRYGLKHRWGNPCGFESRRLHHAEKPIMTRVSSSCRLFPADADHQRTPKVTPKALADRCQALRAASIAAAACACNAGTTWLYVSKVRVIVA